jgi:hypothetical protein
MAGNELRRMYRRGLNAVASKGGWGPALRHIMGNPRSVRRILMNQQAQNWYYDISNDDEVAAFVSCVTACEVGQAHEMISEIRSNQEFQARLSQSLQKTKFRPQGYLPLGRRLAWYAVIRIAQPDCCVETGVHDGLGSSVILQALEENLRRHHKPGLLISIDLPSSDLPTDFPAQPGWLVPEQLRHQYQLMIGDSRRLLPEIAVAHEIGFFIHDSDHSPQNESFELETVWPAMAPGGIVMTDNGPEVLRQFVRQHGTVFCTFRERVMNHNYSGAGNSATVKVST